jgi:transmembrane sensor
VEERLKVKTDYFMELIIKYLNRDLNSDEAQKLVDWVNESNENKNKFLQYKDLWFAGNPAGSDQEKTLFAWEDFEGKIQWDGKGTIINLPDRKIRFLNSWYFKAAASFIFIIGIVYSVWILQNNRSGDLNNTLSELVTPSGAKDFIELNDGTKVWLNAESTLSYPEEMAGKERRVFLTGEAYFEVSHKKRKPFIIETSALQIKVLGTRFDVSAYSDDEYIITTLVSGKVQISDLRSDNNDLYILEPNQKLTFSKVNREIKQYVVDVNLYTSWTRNEIIFRDLHFTEVVKRLERDFNSKIEYDENLFRNSRITAKFLEKESLIEILDVLKIPGKFEYEVKDDKIILYK